MPDLNKCAATALNALKQESVDDLTASREEMLKTLLAKPKDFSEEKRTIMDEINKNTKV